MNMETVQEYKMTGEELEKLYDRQKRRYFKSVKGFADFLKIGKTTLYNQIWADEFKNEPIPKSIEDIIDAHKGMLALKNAILRGDEQEDVEETRPAIVGGSTQGMGELLQILATTITGSINHALTQVTDIMREQMDRREEDYKAIRLNNAKLSTTVDGLAQTNATMFAEFTQLLSEIRQPQPAQGKPEFGPAKAKR